MSTTNDALMYDLGVLGVPINDNLAATNTTQATATIAFTAANRVTKASASGTVVIKASAVITWVINESGQTILVYPEIGDSMNGSLNGSLSIPTGEFGVFVHVPTQIVRGGGGGGTKDWRSAAIA